MDAVVLEYDLNEIRSYSLYGDNEELLGKWFQEQLAANPVCESAAKYLTRAVPKGPCGHSEHLHKMAPNASEILLSRNVRMAGQPKEVHNPAGVSVRADAADSSA